MITTLKESLWQQFGASIDMLHNAINAWPDEYWNTNKKFFYNAYHVLVFLDYYLTMPPKNFKPVLPYTFTEVADIPADAIDDLVPDKIYSKKDLLEYLRVSRDKCRQLIAGLTDQNLNDQWIEENGTRRYGVLELLLYNMRHVQHHAAQLNMLLRQKVNSSPDWVSRAAESL